MKNLIITIVLMFSTFTFAQNQGQWSFGIGTDFTTTNSDNTANAGYFVLDGLMVSLEFSMETDDGTEDDESTVGIDESDNGSTNWGIGARYYIGEDGLWAGANLNSAEDSDGKDAMDMGLSVGCSKALGFDDKLWFEPSLNIGMPAINDAIHVGLGMGFRFTF